MTFPSERASDQRHDRHEEHHPHDTRTLNIFRTHDDREIPVAGVYAIDPPHHRRVIGRHLMITKVRGRFPDVSGTITIDDEPERSHVDVEIEVASIDTGNPERDAHLRSPDFFDADTYPTITFRSTKVEAGTSGTWAVTGDLTGPRRHPSDHAASRLRRRQRLTDRRRTHRLQRRHRRRSRGLGSHLERRPRNRRHARRQEGPHRAQRPSRRHGVTMTKESDGPGIRRPATDRSRTIGIIGAGNIGQALARTALRAGRKVVISNSRGPESLAPVVAALGADVSAGTVPEAAAAGIVAIAVQWSSVPKAVSGLQWHGQTVIDATNAWDAELGGRTSSELVADLVPGARFVKAANTLWAELLGADPHEAGGRRVIFLSGDDAAAKASVVELFDAAGFFAIDLGDLVTGGRMQQLRGPLPAHNLVRLPPAR